MCRHHPEKGALYSDPIVALKGGRKAVQQPYARTDSSRRVTVFNQGVDHAEGQEEGYRTVDGFADSCPPLIGPQALRTDGADEVAILRRSIQSEYVRAYC